MTEQAQLLPGALGLLILKAVTLGPLRGYGVGLRIEQLSSKALWKGFLKAKWGTSGNNRRARYYELTSAGRKRICEETASWNRLVSIVASVLNTQPEEV